MHPLEQRELVSFTRHTTTLQWRYTNGKSPTNLKASTLKRCVCGDEDASILTVLSVGHLVKWSENVSLKSSHPIPPPPQSLTGGKARETPVVGGVGGGVKRRRIFQTRSGVSQGFQSICFERQAWMSLCLTEREFSWNSHMTRKRNTQHYDTIEFWDRYGKHDIKTKRVKENWLLLMDK